MLIMNLIPVATVIRNIYSKTIRLLLSDFISGGDIKLKIFVQVKFSPQT